MRGTAGLFVVPLLLSPVSARAANEVLPVTPANSEQKPPEDSEQNLSEDTGQKPPEDIEQKPAEAEQKPLAKSESAAPAATENKADAGKKDKNPTFAVVPGPFYNPNIGVGLNVMPLMMFHPSKKDDVSPPSLVLMTAIYALKPPFETDVGARQSAFVSAATRIYLDEDRWRVVGMAAYMNLFQEFYGIGGDASYSHPAFDYRLEQVFVMGQLLRRVFWKGFYVGGLLGLVAFHTKTDDPANAAILDQLGSGAAWRVQPNVGLLTQYDSRNDNYYPSRGVNLNLRVNGSFKSGEDYVLLAPGLSQFFSLWQEDRLVLAYRIFGQFGFGNLPMSAYARYGIRGTTLGYETGEYMDKMMAGAEAEIRWLCWWRFGAEAGGGVGKVFADFSNFGDQPWLPGVWGSGTFKIMDKQPIRARMTLAYGKSGVLYYFAVGQTF